jgi:hypothetical protein
MAIWAQADKSEKFARLCRKWPCPRDGDASH